jgi:hypothetical protein
LAQKTLTKMDLKLKRQLNRAMPASVCLPPFWRSPPASRVIAPQLLLFPSSDLQAAPTRRRPVFPVLDPILGLPGSYPPISFASWSGSRGCFRRRSVMPGASHSCA